MVMTESPETAETRENFFRLLEIDASQAAEHSDAFDKIRNNTLQGVLLHNVLSPSALNTLVPALERHNPPFLKTSFPDIFRSWFYGRNLNLTGPDLGPYFDEAKTFNQQLNTVRVNDLPLPTILAGVLSALDGNRPFVAPPGPDAGQQYMFTTLRCHMENGYIPAHSDNEFMLRPAYRHLRSVCESHIVSFVLALSEAEAGGTTEIFDYRTPEQGHQLMSADGSNIKPDIQSLASYKIRIPAGSILIFDSGRYLHRLAPVLGKKKRWTACSFMALSKNHQQMYCWG